MAYWYFDGAAGPERGSEMKSEMKIEMKSKMKRRLFSKSGLIGRLATLFGVVGSIFFLSLGPALANSPGTGPEASAPHAMAADSLDLEDHGTYSGEYVFGMTKAVMRSTLTPALKPAALIFTIPLDLVTLPLAVVGGFLR